MLDPAKMKPSPQLLALLAGKPMPGPPLLALMHGYETGQIETAPARRRSNFDPHRTRYFGGPRPRYQRSPDRQKSRLRRRALAWRLNALPNDMAQQLGDSECARALANLIREDFEKTGRFDRTHDEAAAIMGCCSKSVQRAQQRLEGLTWIKVEIRKQPGRQKHLPNIITITSPSWLAWINLGGRKKTAGDHAGPTDREIESGHSCPATQLDQLASKFLATTVPLKATMTAPPAPTFSASGQPRQEIARAMPPTPHGRR